MKWGLLLAAAALTSGCGSLGKPPLPKFALGPAPGPAAQEDADAARWREADVIYYGLTKSSIADSRPAWRLIESLQRSGQPVALGWTEVPATQQPLLERWRAGEISDPQLLDQLALPVRRDWIRRALRPGLLHVALGAPRELLRKIRAGESLSAEERGVLPRDYSPGPEAFDYFVDRVATSARLRRYNPERLYRAHLAAEQMIAENIVRFRRDHPKLKLLVFLPDDAMINPREVAEFVAQKENARQLILDRSGAPAARPQLLAIGRTRGALQIVNRAPEPARHDRGLAPPRLRA